MEENRLSSISKADSDEKMGGFWDSHDFTEFDPGASDTEFEMISMGPRPARIAERDRKTGGQAGRENRDVSESVVATETR